MLRKLRKKRKGQSTAEYAILIGLVVAAVAAMQTYAKRALQARIRDAAQYMINETTINGLATAQYEPYYLQTNFQVTRDSIKTYKEAGWAGDQSATSGYETSQNITRAADGTQTLSYNGTKGY